MLACEMPWPHSVVFDTVLDLFDMNPHVHILRDGKAVIVAVLNQMCWHTCDSLPTKVTFRTNFLYQCGAAKVAIGDGEKPIVQLLA